MKETALKTTINPNDFKGVMQGDSISFYHLQNKNGIEVTFTNYGQRLLSLHTPDKDGVFKDIVLGYDNLHDFQTKRNYYGAVIGRFGNRIAKGSFTIDENKYTLALTTEENHLHGEFKRI